MSPSEEVLTQAQPGGELEDDLQVRACLARAGRHGAAELYQGLRFLADLEPDPKRLRFEALVTGSTMSACSAVGFMNRSACTKKSSADRASRPRALSAVGHDQVGAEVDQPAYAVGSALERSGVEVLAR